MSRTITVGTRGSKLALTQTSAVVEALRLTAPDLDIRIEIISSSGDLLPDAPSHR